MNVNFNYNKEIPGFVSGYIFKGNNYRCSYIRYKSLYRNPAKGTDQVELYNFQPKSEIKSSSLILHSLGSRNIKFLLWIGPHLASAGVNTTILILPVNYTRVEDKSVSGNFFLYPDMEVLYQFWEQGVIDIRSTIDLLEHLNLWKENSILTGYCLGGMLSTMVSAIDNKDKLYSIYNEQFPIVQSMSMEELFESEDIHSHFKIDPISYAHFLDKSKVTFLDAYFDNTLPLESRKVLYDQMKGAKRRVLPISHVTWLPFSSLLGKFILHKVNITDKESQKVLLKKRKISRCFEKIRSMIMKQFKEKFKNSFFIVNKMYLFIAFIFISVQDITLGFMYFLGTFFIFLWKTMTSKVPMEVDKDIQVDTFVYKVIDDKELKIDIYYPLDSLKGKYPLVYFCHGGGWISGFRNQPNNISWCRYLASRGFIASSIDYRYGYKNTIKDILSDYTDGLEFVKLKSDDLRIDKSNIVLMGLSAGAHLALLYSSYNTFMENKNSMDGIQSVVAYYPPSDLKDLFTNDNKSLFARFAVSRTLKGTPTKEEDIYKNYSPISWISEKMISTLIVHGKLDTVIPFDSSVKLIKRLKSLNVPSVFLVHSKGFHSFDTVLKDYTTINIIKKTIRFIKTSIKGGTDNENY